MADVEVAEGTHILSKEIKATNIKSFTSARDICNLSEGLIAFAGNNNSNLNDEQEHTESFGYSPQSDTGRAILALGSNGESNQTQNAFFDITYKALPSHIENKKGAEVHIQGNNGLSLALTYHRAEDTEDESIHIESVNGAFDIEDEKLDDSLQSIKQVMTMMLKEQRARESIISEGTQVPDQSQAIPGQTQQEMKLETPSLPVRKPRRIKQFFKWLAPRK